MGNSISDDVSDRATHKFTRPSRKKKIDLTLKIFNSPLNFEVVKCQILAEIQALWKEDLLQDYYMSLKKFSQSYNRHKLETFLRKLVEYILEERSGMEQSKDPSTSTSPSTAGWQEQDFQLEDNNDQTPKTGRSGKSSQDLTLSSSQMIKRLEFAKKIMKFLELEIAKKDNFFFELAIFFGNLFENKFQADIRRFNDMTKGFGSKEEDLEEEQKQKQVELKEEIKKKYLEAKMDLKCVQILLQNIFQNIMSQISVEVLKEDTQLLQKNDLGKLSLKLLFGKNKCYSNYFELIRLNFLEEESLLKKTLSDLKNLGPEKFRVDPKFCLLEESAPYQQIIDSLNYLNVYTNPIDKFEVISEVRKDILKATQYYWGHESRRNASKQIELTADDLMSIYCYCLASSSNEKVKRHQVFIEDFLCEDAMKFGEKAYYFSTFIGAVDFLISIADNPLKKLEEFD